MSLGALRKPPGLKTGGDANGSMAAQGPGCCLASVLSRTGRGSACMKRVLTTLRSPAMTMPRSFSIASTPMRATSRDDIHRNFGNASANLSSSIPAA